MRYLIQVTYRSGVTRELLRRFDVIDRAIAHARSVIEDNSAITSVQVVVVEDGAIAYRWPRA